MLYVSKLKDKKTIEITDTSKNSVLVEPIKTLYIKYNNKVVEGLSFTPKRKQPKIEIVTPVMLMLERVPIGQVVLLKRNANIGFEHCIKVKQTKNTFEFYNGGGQVGFFILTKSMLVNFKDVIALDVSHIDDNVANLLKKEYKTYLHSKEN